MHPPQGYDILAIQTPGRENRMHEPALERVVDLLDHMVPHLLPYFDRPFVFWGHSFGGIVAFELIRHLQKHHRINPKQFIVTGTTAPHLLHLWQKREVLLRALVAENSPEYIMSLARYVDNAEFIKSIIPMFRRDQPLIMSYRSSPITTFDFPITAFAALQDDMVYPDEVKGWEEYTKLGFRLLTVDGDHWFLNRNREYICSILEHG